MVSAGIVGCLKRVRFDDETRASLDLLAKDRLMTIEKLAAAAFRHLLKKHGRPASLKEALRKSASADVVEIILFVAHLVGVETVLDSAATEEIQF